MIEKYSQKNAFLNLTEKSPGQNENSTIYNCVTFNFMINEHKQQNSQSEKKFPRFLVNYCTYIKVLVSTVQYKAILRFQHYNSPTNIIQQIIIL